MILADGMLIIQDGFIGTLYLVEPDPKEFRVLSQWNTCGDREYQDEQMWAPLALSDGKLLVRSQQQMKCLDVRRVP